MFQRALLGFSLSLFIAMAGFAANKSHTETQYPYDCQQERHSLASARIQAITDADQAERSNDQMEEGAHQRDIERRIEIAGFFAQGCLITHMDYFNAALVFQHGSVPDHYYQAWLWAKRSAELGNKTAKWLSAAALDRYLIQRGFKQLYGTQFARDEGARKDGALSFCLSSVADILSDTERVKLGVLTLTDAAKQMAKMNGEPVKSIKNSMCHDNNKEPPKGLFPNVY
jgi:hypothetical protein